MNESHIAPHTNRKNVFKYITDESGEFISDYGISSVNLINNFNDMPHKIRKKAYSFTLQKSNQNSEYKGRFDINLFKLIRDDFSNDYTLICEFYFKKQSFVVYANEFLSMNIKFEVTNMIIFRKMCQMNFIISYV